MMPSRFLIINADDLGLSPEVNSGIFAAYEQGVLTDTSLLIQRPYAQEAISVIKRIPSFNVGIHIDLDPLLGWSSPGREKLSRRELLSMMDDPAFARKAKKEISEQIEAFLETGLVPSHIDTHHHVHGFLQIFELLVAVMDSYGIKAIRFNKTGYSLLGREAIQLNEKSGQRMMELLRKKGLSSPHRLIDPYFSFSLQELHPGITELMVHPSQDGDQWRQKDFDMLMDPLFMNTVRNEGIKLIGFSELEKTLSLLT